jgi:hypothetical protein
LQAEALVISKEQRSHFIKTVMEDLHEISLQRIAGLGITPKQLQAWLTLKAKSE